MGVNALIIAAGKNELPMVKYLVEDCKLPVNYQSKDGYFALLLACQNHCMDVVHYLVETCDADIGLIDKRGYTAVRISVERQYHDLVQYLLDHVKIVPAVPSPAGSAPQEDVSPPLDINSAVIIETPPVQVNESNEELQSTDLLVMQQEIEYVSLEIICEEEVNSSPVEELHQLERDFIDNLNSSEEPPIISISLPEEVCVDGETGEAINIQEVGQKAELDRAPTPLALDSQHTLDLVDEISEVTEVDDVVLVKDDASTSIPPEKEEGPDEVHLASQEHPINFDNKPVDVSPTLTSQKKVNKGTMPVMAITVAVVGIAIVVAVLINTF